MYTINFVREQLSDIYNYSPLRPVTNYTCHVLYLYCALPDKNTDVRWLCGRRVQSHRCVLVLDSVGLHAPPLTAHYHPPPPPHHPIGRLMLWFVAMRMCSIKDRRAIGVSSGSPPLAWSTGRVSCSARRAIWWCLLVPAFSVPARPISEGAAPCPYWLAPCPIYSRPARI